MEIETTDVIFEDTLEEDPQISGGEKNIFTSSGDPEVESLHGKNKRGRLILQPDFQRQYVWDAKKASKLIESAILLIPLPIIYLSEEKDGKEYVIDGQQRLTSLFSFIDGNFPDGKAFKLSGLNVCSELNGKSFKDLPEDFQDKIRYYKIRTITFLKNSSEDLKFEIFERLNTGSVQLNDQELRNCLYRGSFNIALKEMASDPDFTYICGFKSPDRRMRDIELVLRFCAFYHKTYLNYKPPIRKFLNEQAQQHKNINDKDLLELKSAFKNSCHIIRAIFGTNSFKRFYKGNSNRPDGHWEPKTFNRSLYDILMFSFAKVDKNIIYPHLDAIRESLIFLMTEDEQFVSAIELSTSSAQAVTTRFDKWRTTLHSILGDRPKEARCFSLKLKEELFSNNATCSICNQRIQAIDDSAVDHIQQYWLGGRTIPENARLTHRYCNWARPRSETKQLQ